MSDYVIHDNQSVLEVKVSNKLTYDRLAVLICTRKKCTDFKGTIFWWLFSANENLKHNLNTILYPNNEN